MATPGPAGGRGAGAPKADIGGQLMLMFGLLIAMFVLFNQDIRQALGTYVGYGLEPVVGFGGDMPMVTLLLTGLVMSFFSITVRHFFIDWVGQARNQRAFAAFNKEMKEARTGNNTYKLKKLQELQPEMMAKNMKSTQSQFKIMPITMIVIIPIFAWLANFVYIGLGSTVFSVPWELNADMENSNLLPNWVLLYSLMTLPFGQVLQRSLKIFTFSRKLKALDSGEGVKAEEKAP
ncbi:MAG: hypothetical protein QG582_820 [Candidatus Thermoplasmatota archaeon]|nr:hypothetical protein [Candidatus Thermoplasmatota archaeon]